METTWSDSNLTMIQDNNNNNNNNSDESFYSQDVDSFGSRRINSTALLSVIYVNLDPVKYILFFSIADTKARGSLEIFIDQMSIITLLSEFYGFYRNNTAPTPIGLESNSILNLCSCQIRD